MDLLSRVSPWIYESFSKMFSIALLSPTLQELNTALNAVPEHPTIPCLFRSLYVFLMPASSGTAASHQLPRETLCLQISPLFTTFLPKVMLRWTFTCLEVDGKKPQRNELISEGRANGRIEALSPTWETLYLPL